MYELSDRIERLRKVLRSRAPERALDRRAGPALACPAFALEYIGASIETEANLYSQRPKEQKVLETSNDPNPFQNYPSIASILAFVAKSDGLAAVPLVLREVNLDAETLAEVAYELESVGLLKVAGVVEAAMADAPSELDRCPHEAGSLNARCWLESLQSRRFIRRQSVMI